VESGDRDRFGRSRIEASMRNAADGPGLAIIRRAPADISEAKAFMPNNEARIAMPTNRLEAFSDGVIAVIITIMVLELKAPHETTLAGLLPLLPVFLSYVLSFVYVGIYWNNHHHTLFVVKRVTGAILWANLHLLFWLSLIPFVTAWMSESHFAAVPVALYGGILLMCSVAYMILLIAILAAEGRDSLFAAAIGHDRKGKLSIVLYLVAIVAAFFAEWLAELLYAVVALIWLVPDRRIVASLESHPEAAAELRRGEKNAGE
jgi:uncharacterized membrane protein